MPSRRVKIKLPKIIAPRLSNGDKRETIGHGLPPHIKDGIRDIAYRENKSVSWVLETIIIEYFGFKKPEYVRRASEPETKQKAGTLSYRPRTAKAS